jgi:hypothetical protein
MEARADLALMASHAYDRNTKGANVVFGGPTHLVCIVMLCISVARMLRMWTS